LTVLLNLGAANINRSHILKELLAIFHPGMFLALVAMIHFQTFEQDLPPVASAVRESPFSSLILNSPEELYHSGNIESKRYYLFYK
jgi:hypothetical protein